MTAGGFLEEVPFQLDHEKGVTILAQGIPVRQSSVKVRTPKCSLRNKVEF